MTISPRLTQERLAEMTDRLAQDIRVVDGSNTLGAGALAEALIGRGWLLPHLGEPKPQIICPSCGPTQTLLTCATCGSGAHLGEQEAPPLCQNCRVEIRPGEIHISIGDRDFCSMECVRSDDAKTRGGPR